MSTKVDKTKLTAFDLDRRVRDRHISSGAIEQKAVDRYLADLPDLEANCETMPFDQPAVGPRSEGSA